jgi:SAM-dependent methyltransferase
MRARRMARCVRLLGIRAETRVLDVGGTLDIWSLAPVLPKLVLLNEPRAGADPGVPTVFADGCALPFPDRAFDVVFSNSVIEHVGGPEAQARFAHEIARVGKAYWVQTPNRRFFIEPHLCTPFVHWLPASWQRRIVNWGTVWEWIARPSRDRRDYYLDHYLTRIRLLTAAELRRLFPRACILKERFFGCTKSLVAYNKPADAEDLTDLLSGTHS